MSEFFDHAVRITKDHAKIAVANFRAGQAATLSHVWMLWADQSVLGVFRTEGAAMDALSLMPDTVTAKVERRLIGD